MDRLFEFSSISIDLDNSIFKALKNTDSFLSLLECLLFKYQITPLNFGQFSLEFKTLLNQCYNSNIDLRFSLTQCSKNLHNLVQTVSNVLDDNHISQNMLEKSICNDQISSDVLIDKFIELKNEEKNAFEHFAKSKCEYFKEFDRLEQVFSPFLPSDLAHKNSTNTSSQHLTLKESMPISQMDLISHNLINEMDYRKLEKEFFELSLSYHQQCITIENYRSVHNHVNQLIFDRKYIVNFLYNCNRSLIDVRRELTELKQENSTLRNLAIKLQERLSTKRLS